MIETGIGLRRWSPASDDRVILCGLAGSLTDRVPPGSVVIPTSVGLPSGRTRSCDPQLIGALMDAARGMGFVPATGAMLTAPAAVTKEQRQRWASTFESVDMESALLPDSVRLAVVRVVLDAPGADISPAWSRPASVLLRPWLWPQAVRLAAIAPRYALRAGKIVVAALAFLDHR